MQQQAQLASLQRYWPQRGCECPHARKPRDQSECFSALSVVLCCFDDGVTETGPVCTGGAGVEPGVTSCSQTLPLPTTDVCDALLSFSLPLKVTCRLYRILWPVEEVNGQKCLEIGISSSWHLGTLHIDPVNGNYSKWLIKLWFYKNLFFAFTKRKKKDNNKYWQQQHDIRLVW